MIKKLTQSDFYKYSVVRKLKIIKWRYSILFKTGKFPPKAICPVTI